VTDLGRDNEEGRQDLVAVEAAASIPTTNGALEGRGLRVSLQHVYRLNRAGNLPVRRLRRKLLARAPVASHWYIRAGSLQS